MKKIIYLIVSSMLFVSFYGCSLNKKETSTQYTKTDTKGTVFLSENVNALFEENPSTNILYLTMDRMFRGRIWKDEQGDYFFYRLLFASGGDAEFLFAEKIQLIENSFFEYFNLVSRARITSKHFGGNWWYDFESQVEWISPTVVKLSFTTENWYDRSIKDFYLDLEKITAD